MLGICSATAPGIWLIASPAPPSNPRSAYAFLTASKLAPGAKRCPMSSLRAKPRRAASSGDKTAASPAVWSLERTPSSPPRNAAPTPFSGSGSGSPAIMRSPLSEMDAKSLLARALKSSSESFVKSIIEDLFAPFQHGRQQQDQ